MHFGSFKTNPFPTVCHYHYHYLENFAFDEVPQFLIAQHHRKIKMEKEWTF